MRPIVFAALFGCINGCPGTCCSDVPSESHQKPTTTESPPPPGDAPPNANRHS
jgi:hypothetical protein